MDIYQTAQAIGTKHGKNEGNLCNNGPMLKNQTKRTYHGVSPDTDNWRGRHNAQARVLVRTSAGAE